ncbi:TetR/AcrR family transcriptional regulator [Altericroceibacterium endophyticum]|uniref:TetR family transcriptional regulator n=1 Tax=Altericroceibacterium endophyticum TaxID=1808508 RepID=A0A6I4T756_9SPHN|nr:TetR/AcrR family transcriptional regulator [Altericroceibacterium endophyticum]MXO66319.1 TetR family transcriptional regulator [Altericroceibacterium endophyticum]
MTECGRSRLDRRRIAFIDAAHDLFIKQGYESTTLVDVVTYAGGSLATLYKLFGNKEGLLTAVLYENVRSCDIVVQQIGSRDAAPAAILLDLGHEFARRFLDPERVAFSRIVIAHSLKNQEFSTMFHQTTQVRTGDSLARLFARWRNQGVEFLGTPEGNADLFLGMFIADLYCEAINHGAITCNSHQAVAERVEFFLRGIGMKGANLTEKAPDADGPKPAVLEV